MPTRTAVGLEGSAGPVSLELGGSQRPMNDTQAVARAFLAMADIPARLIALEQRVSECTTKLDSLMAALPPKLVTITEAAAACEVSVPSMRRWVKRGDVPSLKVGHTVRVDLSRLRGKDASAVAMMAAEARAQGCS